MARVEKNAAGEEVRVDTEAFGCRTIERKQPPKSTSKSAGKNADVDTEEGDS